MNWPNFTPNLSKLEGIPELILSSLSWSRLKTTCLGRCSFLKKFCNKWGRPSNPASNPPLPLLDSLNNKPRAGANPLLPSNNNLKQIQIFCLKKTSFKNLLTKQSSLPWFPRRDSRSSQWTWSPQTSPKWFNIIDYKPRVWWRVFCLFCTTCNLHLELPSRAWSH